jgi:hypothetical protein
VTNSHVTRASGLVLLIGAAAFTVHVLARSLLTAGAPDLAASVRQPLWVPVNALGALGAALVLLGLPAVHARIATALGRQGLAGVVLIAVGWMFSGLFLSLFSALIAPWLADEAPSLLVGSAGAPPAFVATLLVALVAETVGAVLLAIPFVRGHARSAWVGPVLLAAAGMVVVGNVLAPKGPSSNVAVNLLSNAGPVLLMVALGALGWRARFERSA